MTELAHNANYAKDGEAWYRDYDQDISLRNFMRKTMKGFGEKRYLEDDELDFELIENLQYNPVSNIDGLIALLYRSMWAAADLRENLKDYEDTGLTPEQITELKKQIPPCKVGDTVYIITKCKNIPAQLDGTMYGPDGGFGTATGYYCPYENNGCPFKEECGECNEFNMKEAVFEDTVDHICIEEDGMGFACENTTGFTLSDIGKTAFSTRAEAEAKLAEMEGK